jgi:2-amino-4-hydroxy-6-hydroxymethyldihydropteridine diphosphokinase
MLASRLKDAGMAEVGIGLGSNLGDRCANIIEALKALDADPAVSLVRASSVYATPPWGLADQPAFLNAAALLTTSLSPEALLETCQSVERALGRKPRQRWGPREIDIDLLVFGDSRMSTERLALPHPGLFERLFVLIPFHEITRGREIAGRDLAQAIARLQAQEPDADVRLEEAETLRLRSAL